MITIRVTRTSAKEIEAELAAELEAVMTDIFVELTSPPPEGTPVDEGTARNGWQLDTSDPLAPEVYNTVAYINRLNEGHSKQSPPLFIEKAIDKHTR